MTSTPLVVDAASATNVGLVRALNEDASLARFPVFIVADGMGGHSAGDQAAQLVVATFESLVGRADVTVEEVRKLLAATQRLVSDFADQFPGGAGATLSGLVAVKEPGSPPAWLVINIGDSRTYRLVGEELVQATVDHSHVQRLVDSGALAPEEAATHPDRNVLLRAVGDGESEADLWLVPVAAGETFLVASDGLTGEVTDAQIGALLASKPTPQAQVSALVEAALAAGGRDNVTAVVVKVSGEDGAVHHPLTRVETDPAEEVTLPRGGPPEDTTNPRRGGEARR